MYSNKLFMIKSLSLHLRTAAEADKSPACRVTLHVILLTCDKMHANTLTNTCLCFYMLKLVFQVELSVCIYIFMINFNVQSFQKNF